MASKTLTKVQKLENRVAVLESAIYQHFSDLDELHGVIWMLRNQLEKPQSELNMYQARNVLNAIFSLSIKQQIDLMDLSDLEY